MNLVHGLKQTLQIAWFESCRKIQSWRIIITLIAAAVVLFLAYSNGLGAMRSEPGEMANNFLRPFVASATLVIGISAVIMSSEDLSTEFEKNTGFVMFTKPLSRYALFAGKFLSGFIASLIVTVFYYAVTIIACINAVGYVPSRVYLAILLALLFLLAVIGICLLFSAVSPRSSLAMIVAFILLVMLPIFLQNVSFNAEPWYSFGYSSGIVGDYALGNQTVFSFYEGSLHTEDFVPNTSVATAVMSAYGILATAFAAVIFRHRSM